MPIGAGTVLSGPALARKARADFIDTWDTGYQASKDLMGGFVQFGLSTDDFVSLFGYGERPVYPSRTPWGEAPERSPHRYRTDTVEQLRWTSEVEWLRRDRELSNLGSIDSDALAAGELFGTLMERLVFQVLLGSSDRKLLETIPNAPDGADMFNATDGASADRFGFSGGNVVASQTWTSASVVRDGFYAAIEAMLQFDDPQGEPAHTKSLLQEGLLYIFPATRLHEVEQAFNQRFTSLSTVTAGNAAVTNVTQDSGYNVMLWPSQRITTDTAFVIATGYHRTHPLIAEVTALPLEEHYYDASNSYEHGRHGLEGAYWEHWSNIRVGLPLGAVQLTT